MSSDEAPAPEFERVEASIGYTFRDRELLKTALQHSSYAHETQAAESNERLEFLGDAVIGLVVAHLLFEAHPNWDEGELTRGLHNLVDRRALAELSRKLELGPQLRLGRTERQSKGETKSSILADAVEAVLGAMYLDGGIAPVAELARRFFPDALASDATPVPRDPKSRFQEWVMARYGVFPEYSCIGDSLIEGDGERFTMEVSIEGQRYGQGRAQNKRQAERQAAQQAYQGRDVIEKAHVSNSSEGSE